MINSILDSNKLSFFIVGAPKSGTTALNEYLAAHKFIFTTTPKEPFYFCREFEGLPGPCSLDEYLTLFNSAPDRATALGEASAMYLFSKHAAQRIREFRKDARIIIMLRNPINLAHAFHSQLLHGLSENEPDFERAWKLQEARASGQFLPPLVREPSFLQYKSVASLGEQVKRYLEVFPRDQVHFVIFDDFVTRTRDVYEDVLDFLCVEPDGRTSFMPVNTNKRNRYKFLASFLNRPPPWASALAKNIKQNLGLNRIGFLTFLRRANAVVESRKELSPEFKKELATAFRDDVTLLSQLVNRDLGAWVNE